jgi:hypothetical protein
MDHKFFIGTEFDLPENASDLNLVDNIAKNDKKITSRYHYVPEEIRKT